MAQAVLAGGEVQDGRASRAVRIGHAADEVIAVAAAGAVRVKDAGKPVESVPGIGDGEPAGVGMAGHGPIAVPGIAVRAGDGLVLHPLQAVIAVVDIDGGETRRIGGAGKLQRGRIVSVGGHLAQRVVVVETQEDRF